MDNEPCWQGQLSLLEASVVILHLHFRGRLSVKYLPFSKAIVPSLVLGSGACCADSIEFLDIFLMCFCISKEDGSHHPKLSVFYVYFPFTSYFCLEPSLVFSNKERTT